MGIRLKDESAGLMGKFRDQFRGPDIPFVVVANGERIYMGPFPSGCLAPYLAPGPSIYKVGIDQGVRLGPPPYRVFPTREPTSGSNYA